MAPQTVENNQRLEELYNVQCEEMGIVEDCICCRGRGYEIDCDETGEMEQYLCEACAEIGITVREIA